MPGQAELEASVMSRVDNLFQRIGEQTAGRMNSMMQVLETAVAAAGKKQTEFAEQAARQASDMQQLKDEVAERLAEMAAAQLSSSQPQQRTELDAEDDEEYVPGLDAPERDPSTMYTAMDLRRAGLTIKPVRVGS